MVKEVKIDKMDELIEALGGGGSGSDIVPTPTAQDEGKVLTANDDGTASWENASGGVPDYSQASQGSVLATQYSGELGWDRPENLLPEGSLIPSITENDNGKVLQAVYNDKSGSYVEWVGTIKKVTYLSAGVTYDDKAGNAYMNLPSANSVVISIYFQGSNDDSIYPSEFLYFDTYGKLFISSTEYQRIVDDPDGSFIVCYY